MEFRSFLQGNGEGSGDDSPPNEGRIGLWHWVGISGIVHSFILIVFLLVPNSPFSRTITYPVYSVELVGGEKLGGSGTVVSVKSPPVSKKKPVQARQKKVAATKKIEKKRPLRPNQIQRVKRLKRIRPPRVALAKKPAAPVERRSKKVSKKVYKAPPQQHGSIQGSLKAEATKEAQPQPGQVREQLIQAALDRVKQRTQKSRGESSNNGVNAGANEGDGAATPGKGGRGGGVLKGIEFLVYRNQMLNLIKERWAWAGKNPELQVTVRFGVLETGDIVGLKILEKSGDPSYDDSVLRAMRKAAPLPSPPNNYRSDFLNVELTFRPKDLRG